MEAESPREAVDVPRISVLILAGRDPALLEMSIQSVRRQSLRDFEVVVVAEGGNSTRGVIDADDGRLRMVGTPRLSRAAAWNLGFEHCRGNYVALLEAGDLCHASRLAWQAACLDRDPGVALVTSMIAAIPPSKHVPEQPARTEPGFLRWWMLAGGVPPLSTIMLRREAALAQGKLMREDAGVAAAFDLCLRLAATAEVARIDEALTLCRDTAPHGDVARVEAVRRVLEDAYAPILGGASVRAADLVARHVVGDAKPASTAVVEEIESTLMTVTQRLKAEGKADAVARALMVSERDALRDRLARRMGKRVKAVATPSRGVEARSGGMVAMLFGLMPRPRPVA